MHLQMFLMACQLFNGWVLGVYWEFVVQSKESPLPVTPKKLVQSCSASRGSSMYHLITLQKESI